MVLEERLLELYTRDPFDEVLAEIIDVQIGLNLEADKEEVFWEQRAQVSKAEKKLHVALKHFENLYTTFETGDDERLFRLVEKQITRSMNDELLKPFTKEEIEHALKTMALLKVLRIDSFPTIFYQRYWHIVRAEISRYYLSILKGEIDMDEINKNYIVLIPKGFSTLLNEAEQKGLIRGAPIRREKLAINHLLFVDNCIFFCDASCEGAHTVRNIIMDYELVSGQQVNFEKLLIYFGASVDSNEKELVTNIFGVHVVTNPEKYLGLPMMVGRKKRWAFANFVDRFRRRIEEWSFRYLSMGGDSKTSVATILAINDEGQIISACTYPYEGVANAFIAEAKACERALLFAIEMGFRKIILERDSLSIIKKLKLEGKDKLILRPISQSIQILKGHLDEVTYHFVLREANRAAHNLEIEGRRRQTLCFWIEEALNSVEKMVDKD
ncbi:hypothetical protein J1N35_041489 [Gossypium stocksii]|uniref:RNase H type-1 domain-containing protein n=1 Tax=Gossypium stocksii TaxID=47602 RepID=A0A9D3ZJG6_9ROSI|nr:hypothetical protein J1N35_041489 [Gossypium stocksii]